MEIAQSTEMHQQPITATQAIAMWKVKDAEIAEELESLRVKQRDIVFAPLFDSIKLFVN